MLTTKSLTLSDQDSTEFFDSFARSLVVRTDVKEDMVHILEGMTEHQIL